MRICMFSRILPVHSPGGMQDHVETLSVGLAARGHDVSLITSGRSDGVEHDVAEGVERHYVAAAPPGRNTDRYWFGAAGKLGQLQADKPFDILHSQGVGAYGVYRQGLPRRYRLPLITSFHGTHLDVLTTSWHTDFALSNPIGIARFLLLSLNLLFRWAYRDLWFARGSDIVIATSDADVDKYKTLFRVDDAHIRKVYNGIDAELFAPSCGGDSLRKALGIPPEDRVILALARLEKDKGVQNAIEVMPQLVGSVPARLVVVGDGRYRAALERLACEKGIAERVHFAGALALSECARYFDMCDVFVDPTLRTDGYDLTIAEAMACSKPVIASDVGANATLIDKATQCDGILIPRGDNRALAREILRVLNDQMLAREMGARARAKIVERFSIPAMVEGMERVYEEAIRSKRRMSPLR